MLISPVSRYDSSKEMYLSIESQPYQRVQFFINGYMDAFKETPDCQANIHPCPIHLLEKIYMWVSPSRDCNACLGQYSIGIMGLVIATVENDHSSK